MTKVVADISISLDGFVTGPDAGLEQGLGVGGEPLHTWAMQPDDVDAEVLQQATTRSGAVVMGRRLFDIIDGPGGWDDEMGYGAGLAATPPFVVVTHAPPAKVRLGLSFTFVIDGIEAAIEQARLAAPADKDVVIMGGGDVIRQAIDAGVVEELSVHLAPIVLGAGTPLFAGVGRHELVQRSARVSTNATHIVYEVRN